MKNVKVVEGIVTSSASKDGGFGLARPVTDITVYDVYRAVDGGGIGISISGMAHRIFVDDDKLKQDEAKVLGIFEQAAVSYEDTLKKLPLSELLIEENYRNGWTDWAAKAAERTVNDEAGGTEQW